MAANTPRSSSVSHCLGRQPATISPNKTVCIFWLNGKCNRTPCRFLHCEMPVSCATKQSHTESYGPEKEKATSIRLKNNTYIRFKNKLVLDKSSHEDVADKKIVPQNIEETGSSPLEDASKSSSQKGGESCTRGSSCNNKCQFQNSGHCVEELTTLTCLQGHTKAAIMGIALPECSNKLYSGCSDGTIRVWDCSTAQCVRVIDLGNEIGSTISKGGWLFTGMRNVVKVWNTQSGAEYTLDGFTALIYVMGTTDDMLFAGGQVWDHKTLECVKRLDGHTDTVTSLVCWDQYLLSGSLDRTIRVWAMNEKCDLEVIYTHNEEHGILAFCGMIDGNDKLILCCSCCDNFVHLYELSSFANRGRLCSNHKVGSMRMGPMREGLLFIGDQAGAITVWKWLPKLKASYQE